MFEEVRKLILLLLAHTYNPSMSLCVTSSNSLVFTAPFNRTVFKLLSWSRYLPEHSQRAN